MVKLWMEKINILITILCIITLIIGFVFAQNTIDVVVEGISDGMRSTKQIDRDKAIMDAKLKAIERAGIDISSVTVVENFQLKKDWIESKAKSSILPGFQIVEVGYTDDGLYHVVLSCKLNTELSSAKTSANTFNNPAGIEFVFVKGGTFQMGDTFGEGFSEEKPVHIVTVSDFYMGKNEVTVAQYRLFCIATGRNMPKEPTWGWKEKNPIVNVNWDDVEAFCEWSDCRLPTEAEWEYAAKGGKTSKIYNYAGSNNPDKVAWYKSNSGDNTHSVGQKTANELGLFDMSGNVWEWCSDWYDKKYYYNSPNVNPKGPSTGSIRVVRGGSWYSIPKYLRCALRGEFKPGRSGSDFGFRCARNP